MSHRRENRACSAVLPSLLLLTCGLGALQAQDGATCADCAELGRTAARLQLAAFQAADVALHADDLKRQADDLALRASIAHDGADQILLAATDAQGHGLEQKAQALTKDYRTEQQKADQLQKQSEALLAKAASAAGDAKKLAAESAAAWQAYYDCLKNSRCSDGSAATEPADFSACPEAQEWLDRANGLHDAANKDRESANDARARGDANAADKFDQAAMSADDMARTREREAAYALEKCADRETAAANAAAAAVPQPAAVALPRNGELTSKMTIVNNCQTPENFRLVTDKLPASMVDTSMSWDLGPGTRVQIDVIFKSTGIQPGLYSGTISVVCTSCGTLCPQQSKTFPVQLQVPAAQ